MAAKITGQARRFPAKIAVEYEGRSLSYLELERESDKVARLLHDRAGSNRAVAIILDRSPRLIVSILGVLKCGLIFVPIDPSFPGERVRKLLQETGAEWLITSGQYREKFREAIAPDGPTVLMVEDIRTHKSGPGFKPVFNKHCYIYFTSGSTGVPRGVLGRHRSLTQFIEWEIGAFGVDESFVVSQFTNPSFDPFLRDIFVPLTAGARCCIPGRQTLMNPARLVQWIDRHRVTLIHIVPSLFKIVMKEVKGLNCFKALRCILFAGELLRGSDIGTFVEIFKDRIQLVNLYGPTETTLAKLFYRIRPDDVERAGIPVGTAIGGAQAMVLNPDMKRCLVGNTGEIYIRTPFISSGYLNDPGLTAEVFLKNPYTANPRDIIYRSGDLGRLLPDGNIEIVGRVDHQVKIRGVRIETGEIENQLLKHDGVGEALVAAGESQRGDKYLCAYVVLDKHHEIEAAVLREYLSKSLPDYMIPTYFVFLERLPLSVNGKVDRGRLPDPLESAGTPEPDETAAADVVEQKIAAIWKEVLGLDHVGVNSNFFDLGGNSLKIMEVSSGLNRAFHLEIPVTKLFEHSTIRSLANYLREIEAESSGAPAPGVAADEAAAARRTAGGLAREIAVIGMSCRFPGAKSVDEFWENLRQGNETISFFSDETLSAVGVDTELLENPGYVRAASQLEDKELFDAAFFGYTPAEAELLDPQVRLFHECCWQALEDSGIDPAAYGGLIGVYAGAQQNLEWESRALLSGKSRAFGDFAASKLTGIRYLCTRLSYNLDLKGPSVTIQTACSTSLVAIHTACRALSSGECDAAIAGGVTVLPRERPGYVYGEATIFSADGHCRTFDARGSGTIFGEGVGVVVLKPLDEAGRQGYNIHAVIKGSAINNDGSRKVGFTAPSVGGQVGVIRAALQCAAVKPESIGYVEAHGTATSLGDPIEIEALTRAFNTDRRNFCRIGSVKSNFGHLDAAAGAAGFIKAVLSLKNRTIPPSLHFQAPNPAINFRESPFTVNACLTGWPAGPYPRRAGVSSFGMGGTNAHLILEEAPEAARPAAVEACRLFVLSAKTAAALERSAQNLARFLEKNPAVDLADAAYTLQVGRRAFRRRAMFVCSGASEAVEILSSPGSRQFYHYPTGEEAPPVVFMFPGQGSQYVDMGLELYRQERLFSRTLADCFAVLNRLMGRDMKAVLYPDEENRQEAADTIDRTAVTQPVIFAFEYALARQLMEWGIKPAAMIGYSFGEYVAACLAGVFSPEEALALVVLRGRLMQEMPAGAMLSVPLPEEALRPLLAERLSIAVVNNPSCIVSGPKEDVDIFAQQMRRRKLMCMPLNAGHAAHSQLMDSALERFEQALGHITLNRPQVPYISSMTGRWITAEEAVDYRYWVSHLRETVRFSDGVVELAKKSGVVLLEVGPGRDLSVLAKRYIDSEANQQVVDLVRPPLLEESDLRYLLRKIGRLWLYGVTLNWPAFYGQGTRRRISLPTYPFEGKRYWLEAEPIRCGGKQAGTSMESPPADETEPAPLHTRPDLSSRYAAPRSAMERAVVDIWQGFFGLDQVGIDDDFFELGGDSLKAAMLTARIHEETGVEVTVADIFTKPTAAALAQYLKNAAKDRSLSIKPARGEAPIPLSFQQERYWRYEQNMPGFPFYSLPFTLYLSVELDLAALRQSVAEMARRHEVLRTTFKEKGGRPVQVIAPGPNLSIPLVDMSHLGGGEALKKAEHLAMEESQRAFDLTHGPLMRITAVRLASDAHLLIMVIHHIIFDGWSSAIFFQELLALYRAHSGGKSFRLPRPTLQYADYAVWQRDQSAGGILKEQLSYWQEKLGGCRSSLDLPALNLPTDYPRRAINAFPGSALSGVIPGDIVSAVHQMSQQEKVTPFTVMLAALDILLLKWTGTSDIIVGTAVAGRNFADIRHIIGDFSNFLALRVEVSTDRTGRELLGLVRDTVNEAFDHIYCPFIKIVDALGIDIFAGRGQANHDPLYNVAFNFHNLPGMEENPGGMVRNDMVEIESRYSFLDLEFNAVEAQGEITLGCEYKVGLFKETTIKHLIDSYIGILRDFVKDPGMALSRFRLTGALKGGQDDE